ncbi:PspA/IM30 family protein [Brasilonema octagenarum UFV-E1]|uniref:PspA/IM30 family protein n=1 Tax=Brasilonema sennae CENA114 TaxID=415709 RepID=A0A856MJU4_9CYAN|nr:PspA/IM30 family protein [Brasilonema sennae]QDL11645.1 PspA/IM30 family protein [Brasilonema sennae CENA114]QDL18025.1 PspA/IM30 family protein [Brasilonema octagenarum UFV-E1]
MGLIDRIRRVIRANLNSLTVRAEDPEKILEETVQQMQENLMQLRQGIAQAIATQKRTERQMANAQSVAEEWYRRAQLALQQGNESLAREALTKRLAYQQTGEALATQIDEQSTVVARIKKDMRTLELKIAEAKTKKDMYIARARSAEASYKLQEMLGTSSSLDGIKAFERMEEKVLQLEAQTEAISTTSKDALAQQFASLEQAGDVDAELAALQKQLSTESQKRQQLPKTPD